MAEKVKIHVLGTSSAVPTERRSHIGMLVSYKENNFLFDCGEGTQRQMRLAKLSPCKIDKIFISHWHGDHILGLPGILQTMALNGYNETLEIYGPKGTKEKMADLLNLHMKRYFNWSKHIGCNFDIKVFEQSSGNIIENNEFLVDCLETEHGCNCLAYSFTVKEKSRLNKEKLEKLKLPNGPLVGKLAKGETIEYKGKKIDGSKLVYVEEKKKFCYISDTGYFDGLINFAKDSKVLISESTYSVEESELAEKHYHLTSGIAAEIAKKSNSKSLFLTHFSQRYSEIPHILEKEAKKVFLNTKALEDFDVIEF